MSNESFVAIVVSVLTVLAILGGSLWWESEKCSQVGEMTGKDTQWRFMSGCYVKVGDRWLPRDSWRGEYE
jgi:hypothetical protein